MPRASWLRSHPDHGCGVPGTSTHAIRYLRGALVCCVCVCVCACTAPAPQSAAAVPPIRPLHRGPLSDLVSAAGLRWLVLVKPHQIVADPELGKAIEPIVPRARFDAFAESSGVDLRTVPEAVVAGFPYSTLYLATLPNQAAAQARVRFRERLLSGAVIKHPHPALVRMTGVVGLTPETLLTVDDRQLALAVGDPLSARIAEAYAEERLKNSPSALHGAALSTLPDLSAENLAVLLAPGPFADEWQRAADGLLQSTVAIAIAAKPIGGGKIATTVCLAGAWKSSATDAANRLRAAWTTFAQSSAGRLFGINDAAEVDGDPELLTLRIELELAPLVRGLRASVLGDVSQILNLPLKSSSKRPGPAPRVVTE